jgi:hypothetical protein
MEEKNTNIEDSQNDDQFVGAKLFCESCELYFGYDPEFWGVVTCPYCSEYVGG